MIRLPLPGRLALLSLLAGGMLSAASAAPPPTPLRPVAYAGDRSVIVHWDRSTDPGVAGYHVYRATSEDGPFTLLSERLIQPGFVDLQVTNGSPRSYRIRAVRPAGEESPDSETVRATPLGFADDGAFLEYVQRAHFDYFWYLAHPATGLIPDRSTPTSPCSIAAVGFGLSAITVGVDHGWISREEGRERTRLTLRTFADAPQGATSNGKSGYRGWYYHFLDMRTAARAWASELSSIDTALLLAGVLHAREYFDGADPAEEDLRSLADTLLGRVDWQWMRNGQNTLALGWKPESGFLPYRWIGYSEGMLLYLLGIGAPTNPLPSVSWTAWTTGYRWRTQYGYDFVQFPPLFGHQYSHCWFDFRHVADPYMRGRASTYFENSRRATLAQRAYCIENPGGFPGYGPDQWGITACDGPGFGGINGYIARGAPPAENDDGTLAPTAVGGSVAFAPDVCVPALRHLYDRHREKLWTAHGFRDAFNLRVDWWGPDTLGIDQGPIVLMIENHRTGGVWRRFMRAAEARRGLATAGFDPVAFLPVRLVTDSPPETPGIGWATVPGRRYQVEYSGDLDHWHGSPTGGLAAEQSTLSWTDSGPPATDTAPGGAAARFYRVFQYGPE